jgi:hypothetical protein
VQRVMRCITLSFEADCRVQKIVSDARSDPALARRLGLADSAADAAPPQLVLTQTPVPTPFTPGPRALTRQEITTLAEIMRAPYLRTQRQVLRAMNDFSFDPVLTSRAIGELREIYTTPPAPKLRPGRPRLLKALKISRRPFINISRVIEALIMRGAVAGETEIEGTTIHTAPTGDVAQAVHQSSNRKTRKVDAAARLYRGTVKSIPA